MNSAYCPPGAALYACVPARCPFLLLHCQPDALYSCNGHCYSEASSFCGAEGTGQVAGRAEQGKKQQLCPCNEFSRPQTTTCKIWPA